MGGGVAAGWDKANHTEIGYTLQGEYRICSSGSFVNRVERAGSSWARGNRAGGLG